ncbi:uncharacterized protein V6R79_001962 [Siganus canaliculatus]
MMQSVEEPEKADKEIDEEDRLESEEEDQGEDDTEGDEDEEDEEDGDNEDQEGSDIRDSDVKEEAVPDKTEENIETSVKPKEKKQSGGLNLNNEVVKMRKEMKTVRVLVIRKLTRQIAMLKKKKGKEAELEKNQKRAARLLEEIHALKDLLPDQVTKTALQKNLNFEQVCKNPKSTMSDRAVARLVTHPQFSKKIEIIKAAVKAFREERMKDGKQARKEKVQNKPEKAQTLQSLEKVAEKKGVRKEDITEENEKITDKEEGNVILKDSAEVSNDELEKESEIKSCLAGAADGQRKKMPEPKTGQDIQKCKSQSKNAAKKPGLKSFPEELHKEEEEEEKEEEEEESDLESSDDEEKEYFDDSTEERFHKRSSQSEESEGDDDFFIGKVSRFKKKKKKGAQEEKGQEVKADQTDKVQGELDELESRLKSKAMPLQSVFCSLSASKSGGGRGAERGRGGDKFRGRGKSRADRGINRDFGNQTKFEKRDKGAQLNSGSKYEKSDSSEKGFSPAGRGRGRGRGVNRQTDRRGGGVFSHHKPQQALHPSWEASKKRKEQQGQIVAFQGKKIKFDDDD